MFLNLKEKSFKIKYAELKVLIKQQSKSTSVYSHFLRGIHRGIFPKPQNFRHPEDTGLQELQTCKPFSRQNVFNSCIQNTCVSVCIKGIIIKKHSLNQNWFIEIQRNLINFSEGAQEAMSFNIIRGAMEIKFEITSISNPELQVGLNKS